MANRPIIQIKDLTRFYQMGETEVRALNGVTFDVLENE
ncbi:MAG TPA: macrolide ABC transporter ATP-binding protein, partial [Balneola sp.]|nr:macrolide ABC transporter ATP-binding protein [Balneola sp.]